MVAYGNVTDAVPSKMFVPCARYHAAPSDLVMAASRTISVPVPHLSMRAVNGIGTFTISVAPDATTRPLASPAAALVQLSVEPVVPSIVTVPAVTFR